jgi:hypothetical protein
MEIGGCLDYIDEYVKIFGQANDSEGGTREASQADFDSF